MSIFTKAHDFVDWIEVKWWAVDRFWKYKILRRRQKEWPFIMYPESLAILYANTAMTKLFDKKWSIPANTGKEIQFFQSQPLMHIDTLPPGAIIPLDYGQTFLESDANGAWQKLESAMDLKKDSQ